LHTELAPANAILQRAGRCARFQDETGHVYVYPVENALPYKGQEAVMQLTEEWLRSHDGSRLNFVDEQALVDFAHGAFDEQVLQGVVGTTWKHRQRMQAALNGDRETAGELVRKVASQQVTISAEPDRLLARPFAAPMFSLHPGTLQGAAKTWLEEAAGDIEGDVIWRLEEVQDDGQESDVVRYFWRPVRDKSLLRGASLIALHPSLADYNADDGLILHQSGSFRAEDHLTDMRSRTKEGSDWIAYYRLESYEKHIRLVYDAFARNTWRELDRAAAKLERRAGWPVGSLRQAAELAVLFHDLGKLAKDWQQWVLEWQKRIGKPAPPGFWAAHTDFEGHNARHVEWQRKTRRRPPHAVEGAIAASPLLVMALREQPPLLKAVFSAIARHHGAFSSTFQKYQLPATAGVPVLSTMSLASDRTTVLEPSKLRMSDDPARTSPKAISSMLVDAARTDELLAYMLLARALRRADQLGTAEGTKIP
jgi:CRISPR-associated endonuclease/helicase Cas3